MAECFAEASSRSGQVVLVTGGNRGLGLEVVRSILEKEGHFVYLGCRDLEAGRRLAESLCAACGEQRIVALQLDVASAESITQAAKEVETTTGHLDVLVNNAGILLEGNGEAFEMASHQETMNVNFEGAVVAVTEAFLPLLAKSSSGGQVLSTSSGAATRAMALLQEEHRQALLEPSLDLAVLRKTLQEMVAELANPNHAYHDIPTISYSFSKLGVNCFTQILARENPTMRINACSPGFCNTGMCANYTGKRQPKDPALGASIFWKVLFGTLGQGQTGAFFKEASKPGTPLAEAVSVPEPWVASG